MDGEAYCSLRNHHAISVYCEGEQQSRSEMFVGEAAKLLGVTSTTMLRLIGLKQLPATQVCANAPWIMRKADVDRCMAERNRSATPATSNSAQLELETRF
jgi:excisionase family DNA binding protein